MFNKRHYEWLAEFARYELRVGDRAALATALERTNVNFNRRRFEDAAGITEYEQGVIALRHSATP